MISCKYFNFANENCIVSTDKKIANINDRIDKIVFKIILHNNRSLFVLNGRKECYEVTLRFSFAKYFFYET